MAQASGKVRILAVDDEHFNLMLLRNILRDDEYELECCSNAVDALAKFKARHFDMVLLDVMMPGIDGVELYKLIRAIDSNIPVLFLSAIVDSVTGALLRQVSDDDRAFYVGKDLNREALMSRIKHTLGAESRVSVPRVQIEQYQKDLTLAGDVQRLLLPPWCVADGSLMLSSLYLPRHRVSGDAFDALVLGPDRYLLFIGDITGHGVQAALYMSAVQSILKLIVSEWAPDDLQPHRILTRLNDFLCNELGGGRHMTCMVAIVDFKKKHLSCQSAGHPWLICCSPSTGRIFRCGGLDKGDIPLGWQRDRRYEEAQTTECDFAEDTVFWAFSDGILDLRNASGETPVLPEWRSLLETISCDPEFMSQPYRLLAALAKLGYEQCDDDITVIAFTKRRKLRRSAGLEMVVSPDGAQCRRAIDAFYHHVYKVTGNENLAIKVELLIHEFINNVIVHGIDASQLSSSRIYVKMYLREQQIDVVVLDRGRAWDWQLIQQRPEPLLRKLNGSMATSGRGLAMIRSIAGHITYNRYGELNCTRFMIDCKGEELCQEKI